MNGQVATLTAPRDTADQASYTDVTVTPLEHRGRMSNSVVAAKAVEPAATGTVDTLVAAAIEAHLHLGRTPDADERVAALAGGIADSRWRSYRAGRVRVAGLLGVYWQWCAPPLDSYRPVTGLVEPVTWSDGNVVFTDVIVVDGADNDPDLVERVGAADADGFRSFRDLFAGVRLLRLSAPNRSRLIHGARTGKLIDTDLWFGGCGE